MSLTSSVPPARRARARGARARRRRRRRRCAARRRPRTSAAPRRTGRGARGPRWCRTRATSSRPVPCSPQISDRRIAVGEARRPASDDRAHRRAVGDEEVVGAQRSAEHQAAPRRRVRVHRRALAFRRQAEPALALDQLREVVLDERARRREVRRLPHAQPQRVAAVEAARVPRARLAHLVQRARAGLELLDQLDVAAEHRERAPRASARPGSGRPARDLAQPREQPRVAERAAADHHGVAAGLLAHAQVALDVDDVAVADDRDVRAAPPSRTRRMMSGSLLPEKPCVRVRPCTVIICAPASTIAHANSGALRWRLVPAGAVLDGDRHVRRHRARRPRARAAARSPARASAPSRTRRRPRAWPGSPC